MTVWNKRKKLLLMVYLYFWASRRMSAEKGFASGGNGVGQHRVSVRRDQRLLLTVSSKMDPMLAKVDPKSETGGISITTYLRKGKKYCIAFVNQDWENVYLTEAALQASGVVQKEGSRCSGVEQWSLQPRKGLSKSRPFSCSLWMLHRADFHLWPQRSLWCS